MKKRKYEEEINSVIEEMYEEEINSVVEEMFEHKGFTCVVVLKEIKLPIKFHTMEGKWRCGYVGVKKEHPLYKKDYMKIDEFVLVHRGLTFSNFGDGEVLPKDRIWWIGFDCHHHLDTIRHWNFERVKKEVKELAEQFTIKNLILKRL